MHEYCQIYRCWGLKDDDNNVDDNVDVVDNGDDDDNQWCLMYRC